MRNQPKAGLEYVACSNLQLSALWRAPLGTRRRNALLNSLGIAHPSKQVGKGKAELVFSLSQAVSCPNERTNTARPTASYCRNKQACGIYS